MRLDFNTTVTLGSSSSTGWKGWDPEFSDQNTAEGFSFANECESSLRQSLAVIGQTLDPQAGEQSEGPVEQGNQRAGHEFAVWTRWDSEFGDEPLRRGMDVGSDSRGKCGHFAGGEAVEKEVGRDQVVMGDGGYPRAGIAEVAGDAVCVLGCCLQ